MSSYDTAEQDYGAEYMSHPMCERATVLHLICTPRRRGYEIHGVEAKYYADGEDAYDMRKQLRGKQSHHHHHQGYWRPLLFW